MSLEHLELPKVKWGSVSISRLLLGHNPIKGQSHYTEDLDADMSDYFSENKRTHELLKRCQECGINTLQFGAEAMHQVINEYTVAGGNMQWIATLYGNESGDLKYGSKLGMKEELDTILTVNPKPIGVQHYGEKTDRLYFEGKLDIVRERMKRLRDTGLLIGVGTHLPNVINEIMSQGWDVDFYQTCLYTVYSQTGERSINRSSEVFNDEDREKMLGFVKQADKPCIVFKVLGANRKCLEDNSVENTLKYIYNNIKDTDVVLAGMWQKYMDQVGINTDIVKNILY